MQIGGTATGDVRVVGEASAPGLVGIDAAVVGGLVRVPDYAVDGPFALDLEVREPFSGRPRGSLELDLTDARVEYQSEFEKRAGMRAEMVSKFAPDAKGEIVFESRIKLRDIDEILLQGRFGKSISVAATTPVFDVEGLSELMPALAPFAFEGPVAFEGLGLEWIEGVPSRFRGRLDLQGVGVSVPDAGRWGVSGQLLAEGTKIRTQGLKLKTRGLELSIRGEIDDPLGAARYALTFASVGTADVNDLLSAQTSVQDKLFGALELSGEIEGSARSRSDVYSSARGRVGFTVGKGGGGLLRGVPILRAVLHRFPALGSMTRLTPSTHAGRSVDDYLSERFEVIEGDFEIGRGRVQARPLRLAYAGYEARLEGPIVLEDLALDMKGEIRLASDLVDAVGGWVRVRTWGKGPQARGTAPVTAPRPEVGAGAAKRAAPEPIRIPLARVTNTLSEPRVELTAETLAAVPRLLFEESGRDLLSIGIGKAIGRVLGDKGESNR
jgi:hypothetical protein